MGLGGLWGVIGLGGAMGLGGLWGVIGVGGAVSGVEAMGGLGLGGYWLGVLWGLLGWSWWGRLMLLGGLGGLGGGRGVCAAGQRGDPWVLDTGSVGAVGSGCAVGHSHGVGGALWVTVTGPHGCPPHPQARSRAGEELRRALRALESHLRDRTFLVGDDVTLADVTVTCALLPPFQHVSRPPRPPTSPWTPPRLSIPPHVSLYPPRPHVPPHPLPSVSPCPRTPRPHCRPPQAHTVCPPTTTRCWTRPPAPPSPASPAGSSPASASPTSAPSWGTWDSAGRRVLPHRVSCWGGRGGAGGYGAVGLGPRGALPGWGGPPGESLWGWGMWALARGCPPHPQGEVLWGWEGLQAGGALGMEMSPCCPQWSWAP